jgi:hypothetical protein
MTIGHLADTRSVAHLAPGGFARALVVPARWWCPPVSIASTSTSAVRQRRAGRFPGESHASQE